LDVQETGKRYDRTARSGFLLETQKSPPNGRREEDVKARLSLHRHSRACPTTVRFRLANKKSAFQAPSPLSFRTQRSEDPGPESSLYLKRLSHIVHGPGSQAGAAQRKTKRPDVCQQSEPAGYGGHFFVGLIGATALLGCLKRSEGAFGDLC
jgi:hypothetical protein